MAEHRVVRWFDWYMRLDWIWTIAIGLVFGTAGWVTATMANWSLPIVFISIIGIAAAGAIIYLAFAHFLESRVGVRDPGVWRKRPELELYVIACRSTGAEPSSIIDRDPQNAQLRHLAQAIERGDLKASGPLGASNEQAFMVRIKREDLHDFAEQTSDKDLLHWIDNEWKVKRR